MENIKSIFSILGYTIDNEDKLFSITIDADSLKDPSLIMKLYDSIPDFKQKYKSNSLTCLHQNSLDKQKFPAVNFIRQILKCNNYKFHGYYVPMGYNKQTGQKILKRCYKIINLPSPPPSPIYLKSLTIKL